MKLSELVSAANMPGSLILGGSEHQDVDIRHIAEDSRRVEEGCLFVAVKGSTTDGHRFIRQALEKGAVAVAGSHEERPGDLQLNVPYVYVPDDRRAVALFAAAFFGFPSRKLQVVGVTGTDGKTT